MSDLIFRTVGLGDDAVDYLAAWDLQRDVHAAVVAGEQPDTVLLLEHPPVFTAGKRTDPHERPADPGGAAVIDVDRGGKITFHGPGQLVGYPIVTLPDHVKVVDYVRRVEEALIAVCADFGVTTARVPGRSGVWLCADDRGPERKIAALGIRVSRGVTMHGFSLNCDVDLGWYDRFVPCGISDAGVTTLSRELGRDVTVEDVLPSVQRHLADYLAWAPYEADPRLRAEAGAGPGAAHRADHPRGLRSTDWSGPVPRSGRGCRRPRLPCQPSPRSCGAWGSSGGHGGGRGAVGAGTSSSRWGGQHMGRRIIEMYAWVSDHPDGEGVLAAELDGLGTVPLVGADLARADSLRPVAQALADAFGQEARLLRFTVREECEVLLPKDPRP